MMIEDSGHGISLGGLALVKDGRPVIHPEGFTTEVSSDGTTWGNPAVVVSTLISELSSGDLVEETHVGNREPVLYVRLLADSHDELVAGDTALSRVVGPAVPLVWQPPSPDAPPTVIDVLHSRMDHAWDDWDSRNQRRVWIISMSALPDVRSAEKVITPAIPVATASVVNDGTSTTGWSSTNGTVTVSGGAVVSTYDGDASSVPGLNGTILKLTAAVDTDPEHYVSVDWLSSVPVYHYFFPAGSSVALPEVRREPSPISGYTRSFYYVPASSLTSFTFLTIHQPAAGSPTLRIAQVEKSASLPISGTAGQLTSTVDPGGNRPALGDVLVQHPTSGLGHAAVYSYPIGGGYNPALRGWLASSDTVTPDANAVSGATNPLTGITRYHIPVESVPEGDVHLWARLGLASGTPGDVNFFWSAWSIMGSTILGDPQAAQTRINFPTLGGWVFAPIARLTLPTTKMGPAGKVYIDLQRDASAPQDILLDEAYLFGMDRGRLTVVDCGQGTPAVGTVHNRLRVSAPSLDNPNGAIQVATAADWSDAYTPSYAKVKSDQTGHLFDSDGAAVLTVTEYARGAATSFEHHARWRAEAGRV